MRAGLSTLSNPIAIIGSSGYDDRNAQLQTAAIPSQADLVWIPRRNMLNVLDDCSAGQTGPAKYEVALSSMVPPVTSKSPCSHHHGDVESDGQLQVTRRRGHAAAPLQPVSGSCQHPRQISRSPIRTPRDQAPGVSTTVVDCNSRIRVSPSASHQMAVGGGGILTHKLHQR